MTILGTEIRIHVTFLFLVAWYAIVAGQAGGRDAAVATAVFVLLVFLCILLHEFGHILAARRYGIRTPEVLLSPIGGLARLERLPEEPRQELIVALAGPLVTLVIAAALGAWLQVTGRGHELHLLRPGSGGLVSDLFRVNVFLLAFNLIPAFPMDGGRVLRALLAKKIGLVRGTRIAARVGQFFAFILGMIGLTGAPMLIIIAGFIYIAAEGEAQAVETRVAGQGITASAVMITDLRLLPVYATLEDAVRLLLAGEQREFPVVDNDQRLEGLLTRDHLIRGLSEHGPATIVSQVMASPVQSIGPGASFDHALHQLRTSGLPALPVVDEARRVVGLITTDNIADLILVRRHMPAPS
ncbi:MAG TPA: site-2 protease family protein [Gemmatimonadales bacterium]|nr:site-2 protease family protein [Gemmatimonadales bacterium]